MKKSKARQLKSEVEKLRDEVARLRKTAASYEEVARRAKAVLAKNAKLKRALAKLAGKRRLDRARLDNAAFQVEQLSNVLRNLNQWQAASTLAAEYQALTQAAKAQALQQKYGIDLKEQPETIVDRDGRKQRLEYADDQEQNRLRAFRQMS